MAEGKKKKKFKKIKVNEKRHMTITPPLRLSFPKLFTPVAFTDENGKKGEPKFSCDLIADSKDLFKEPYNGKKKQYPSLMQAIRNVKEDQWGDKEDWPKMSFKNILDGNDRVDDEGDVIQGYADSFYIRPRSHAKRPPDLKLRDGSKPDEDDLYGGCFVRAQILCRPYHTGVNTGVSLQLVGVQKWDDGARFGFAESGFDYEENDAEDESDDSEDDEDGDDE